MPARTDNANIFRAPPDPDARIWRYLDFPAYVWMLHRRELFLSRADMLGDPWEGATSPLTLQLIQQQVEKVSGSKHEDFFPGLSRLNAANRSWTYVSCWHVNTAESAAMWKLYGVEQRSIAVRSTYRRLAACVPDDAYVGLVQYVDYAVTPIPTNNLLWPYVHKRLSFAHERELRAVLPRYASPDGQLNSLKENPPAGFAAPIAPDALIEAVFVAPGSPAWFRDLVADVTDKYGLPGVVAPSALDERPIF